MQSPRLLVKGTSPVLPWVLSAGRLHPQHGTPSASLDGWDVTSCASFSPADLQPINANLDD